MQNEARNLFSDRKVNEALEGYKNVAQKAQQINYDQGLSNAYIGVANCYYELSNSNEGIKYLILAEKHAQNNPEILARINMIKGFILVNAHSYDEAEKKFKLVIEYANQIKDQKTAIMLIDRAYINIGNIYLELKKYDLALTNYYKSYTSSDIVNRLASGINMAEIFLLTNKMDSARKYIEIAQNNTYLIPEKKFRSAVNEGLRGVKGLYYIKKEDYRKAVNELKNNPSASKTTFYTTEELLGMAYAKQHKTDSALFYLEKNIHNKLNSRLSDQNIYSATYLIYNDEKLALQKNTNKKEKFIS